MAVYQKICKECGQPFETSANRRTFCYDAHYRTCSVCGRSFFVPFNKLSTAVKTCSEVCRRKSISKTLKESVKTFTCVCSVCGKAFESRTQNARVCNDTHYQTCKVCGKQFELSHQQALSGTQTCSKACRYKLVEQTTLERTGFTNVFSNPETREQIKQTMLNKYGVDNPRKSEELRRKAEETSLERYGVAHPMQNDVIQSRAKQSNLERYGVEYIFQNPDFVEKSKQTCIERYGVDNFAKTVKHVSTKVIYPTKYVHSRMKDDVYSYLASIVPSNTSIVRNTFKVITPYEVDLYLPEYNLAIECNPTSTHNSTISGFGETDSPKSRYYHQMKTDMCESKGVFLFHIFGYEWSYKRDVIESMLQNLLNCNDFKVYARKTVVKEVPAPEAHQFLEANHRQTGVNSKIRLGLYYEDELVSLMTFSKMRSTIGTGLEDLSNCYELVRFCNKRGYTVVGGASKLFKHFCKEYSPVQIRSFSDRAHTRGQLYKILRFEVVRKSDPGYVWVDLKTDKGYSRNNAQKRNIKSFLNDETIDLSMTETQIMEGHGFVQVFDSGTITWEWRKEGF